MSHDRGCWCGLERYEYDECTKSNCYNRKSNQVLNPLEKLTFVEEAKAQNTPTATATRPYDELIAFFEKHPLEWKLSENGCAIIDANGKPVVAQREQYLLSVLLYKLNSVAPLPQFEPGYYWIKLKSGDKTTVEKIRDQQHYDELSQLWIIGDSTEPKGFN